MISRDKERRANAKVSNPQYEPKISAKERLEDFKNETPKVVRGNVLFCLSCKGEVSLKKSNLNTHVSSKKHKANKEKQAKISMNEKDIAEALTAFDDKNHPKGETLPTSTRVFRENVVRAFLKSGTPLS